MDEADLASAVRDVTLNPVRARLVERAADWAWSSARAHLGGRTTAWCRAGRCWSGDFAAFLAEAADDGATFAGLRCAETGSVIELLQILAREPKSALRALTS